MLHHGMQLNNSNSLIIYKYIFIYIGLMSSTAMLSKYFHQFLTHRDIVYVVEMEIYIQHGKYFRGYVQGDMIKMTLNVQIISSYIQRGIKLIMIRPARQLAC